MNMQLRAANLRKTKSFYGEDLERNEINKKVGEIYLLSAQQMLWPVIVVDNTRIPKKVAKEIANRHGPINSDKCIVLFVSNTNILLIPSFLIL